jgi:hypothetical protein
MVKTTRYVQALSAPLAAYCTAHADEDAAAYYRNPFNLN